MRHLWLTFVLLTGLAFGQTPWTCSGTLPTSGTGTLTCTSTPITQPLTITTTTLPAGTVGTPYAQTLQASGGTPPYSWTISAGTLPPNLALSGAAITGTPTAAATSSFTVAATDAASNKASQPLSISVASTPPPPTGDLAQAYAAYLVAYAGYKSVTVTPATFSTTAAAPGTVVWLSDGAYNISTRLTTATSGTSAAHVVFAAVNYGMAKINFTNPGSANGWPVWYVTGSYVDIMGIDITTSGSGNGSSCGGIGTPGGANNNTFNYNVIHDIPASTAQCGNGSGGGGIVFGSGTSGSNGDMLEGNVISNIGVSGNQWTHGIYADGAGFTVRNNVVTAASGAGIQCYHNCQSGTIVNNTLMGNYTFGIVAGAYQTTTMSGMMIANNIVTNSPVGYEECDGSGCEAAGGSNVCTNNNFYGNSAATKNVTCASTVTANPQVTAAGVPAAGSPVLGAGSTIYAPPANILGVTVRPPNIGAY